MGAYGPVWADIGRRRWVGWSSEANIVGTLKRTSERSECITVLEIRKDPEDVQNILDADTDANGSVCPNLTTWIFVATVIRYAKMTK